MAANWCSNARDTIGRLTRSRTGAIAVALALVLASTRCISDFLGSPHKGGDATSGPPAPPDTTSPPPAPPARVAASIEIRQSSLALDAIGGQETLQAVARDAAGAVIEGASITWSADDPSVVSVDGGGTVTATGNGATRIVARSGDARAAADVSVRQAVTSVAISPGTMTLRDGEFGRLTAAATDRNGNAVTRDVVYAWHSSKPRTIAVSADPSNSAKAIVRRVERHGSATITASSEDVSGTLTIH